MRKHRLLVLPALAVLLALPARGAAQQQSAPPSVRHREHVPAGGREPPGDETRNPYGRDKQTADEGARLFEAFHCNDCHGGGGVGGAGPSLADGRWRYGGSDGEIYQTIFYGRPRGMPAFGGTLPPEAIWRLVAYLQSLAPARPDSVATVAW